MKIELFDQPDYKELLDIFNDARSSATGFADEDVTLSAFKGMVDGEIILIARMASEIVGFISIWEQENFIHHLYVKSAYQNKGIGRALLAQCKAQFGLPLSLKCLAANQRACRFYGNNGWKAIEKGNAPEGIYILFKFDNS